MARPLRVEYAGAIYHVMSRGNARSQIFLSDEDYRRWQQGLMLTVEKFGFEIFGYVCMPNHVHLFFRTPYPNLSQGMQYLLSGYANWFAKRHERPGHLFQGRFKGELIENDEYFWTVSRYIHLNPVRGKRPLVRSPQEWPWSSYPGYHFKRRQVDWVNYRSVLEAWQGEMGGQDPAAAYRRYVLAGVAEPPQSPFHSAVNGWLLGSQQFVDRIKTISQDPQYPDQVPTARHLGLCTVDDVLSVVAAHFEVEMNLFSQKGTVVAARDLAALVARRTTAATLRELAPHFGLSHPDSVSNLVRRAEKLERDSSGCRRAVAAIRARLERELRV